MVRGVLDKDLDSEMQFKIQSWGSPDWPIYGICYSGDGQGCRLLMSFLQKYKFYNITICVNSWKIILYPFLFFIGEKKHIIYNNIDM